MTPPLTTIALIFILLSPPFSFAGGSISWTEVQAQIQKDDPFLADYIAAHLTVNRVGGALRVGHDDNGNSMVPGLQIATRLPPYHFYAKPKEENGDYTLYLTFEPSESGDGKTTVWQITIRKKLPAD